MATKAYECTALTGGAANALDFIDGSGINNGDIAFTKVNGTFYFHRANTSGGASEDSPLIIVPDTNPGSINWELASSNVPPQKVKTQADSPYSVSASDLTAGLMILNTGATGALNLSLPAGANNYQLMCYVAAAQYLRCTANGSEKFRYLSQQSAGGGYIRSNVVGTFWIIRWLNGEWVIKHLTGTLKYDV